MDLGLWEFELLSKVRQIGLRRRAGVSPCRGSEDLHHQIWIGRQEAGDEAPMQKCPDSCADFMGMSGGTLG